MENKLSEHIKKLFPDHANTVHSLLEKTNEEVIDRNRVLLAILFGANGSLEELVRLVELTKIDWRDVLLQTGFADTNWKDRLKERGYCE